MNLLPKIRVYSLKDTKTLISLVLNLSLILLIAYPLLYPGKASAVVSEAFVRFDRLATGAAITGTACLKTTTSGTETNVVIVFPQGWTISSTASNWTVTTTNLPVDPQGGAVAPWPGIGTASSVVGQSVVFPGSDLTVSTTLYCFNFAGASSTVGSAGPDKTGQLKTQGGAPYVDSVDWATSVVATGADQIVVTASVSASLTFSLSANSIILGTLSSGTTVSNSGSPVIQSVSTNARNGWVSWVKSGTNGGSDVGALHSTTANADIDSPGAFGGGTETLSNSGGYVLDVDTGTGSPTIGTEYNGTTADEGGHISFTPFRQTASTTAPASNTVNLVVKARSSSTTPAATDYTDTLTIVVAGSF